LPIGPPWSQHLAPLLLVLLLLASPACKRKKKTQPTSPEPAVVLLSVVNVADPAGTVQLASGFFELESNTWRWTGKQFTVVLRPPEGAAERGARLELHLNLPDVIVNRIGPVTVSAEIGGTALAPERYAQAGDYVYTRDVEPQLLRGSAVTIHFRTDKALTPTGADTRELALIVLSAGLVAK
jgi:hypothetical protein